MKITTHQIKQIISEELDKLLYEEEDSNDVLRQALAKNITDEDINKHYLKIKDFVIKVTQDLNIQQQMQSTNQMLQSNNNEQIVQAYELFLSLIDDLIKPNEKDTEKQRETKEKILKQIEPFEQFLNAEDQKSFLVDLMIETKDLSGADLEWAKLSQANLERANLKRANLTMADLSFADLREADLFEAALHEANLIGAKLSRADLRRADLLKADLRYADLREADLTGAYLEGINLSETDLSQATLSDAEYNEDTQWPQGFDPIAAGAKKV